MPTGLDQLAPLLAAVVFVAAGAVGAVLFRLGRVAGGRASAAVLGGLLAGFLLGPAVLGQIDRAVQERLAVGGLPERAQLRELVRRQEADLAALRETGVTPGAFAEMDAEHARERRGPETRLAKAESEHRRGVSAALVVLVSCGIGLAWASAPRRMIALWPGRATGVAVASVLAAVMAVISTAVLARWLLGFDQRTALAVGCAFGAGPVAGCLPTRWAPGAGRSGAVGWFGIGATLVAAIALALQAPETAALCVVPVGAAALGMALRTTGVFGRRFRDLARGVLLILGVPGLTAWLVASTDLYAAFVQPGGSWFLAVSVLLAGDAALVGAWLGFKWLGANEDRDRALSVALECVSAGLAPACLCFMAALVGAGWVEPRATGAAAVLGLVLQLVMVDLLVDVNRRAKAGLGLPPPSEED